MNFLRKAQFAMEYLLVVGFSLLIIIPLIVLLNDSFQGQKTDVHAEHLSAVAREISFQAEKIYYQGAPSLTTLQVSFPPQISAANVEEQAILFVLEGSAISIYSESKVPLQGTLLTHQGLHTITLRVEDYHNLDPNDDVVIILDK